MQRPILAVATLFLAALPLTVGCGDDGRVNGGVDGGADAGQVDAADVPAIVAPEEASAPSFLPCPNGWRPRFEREGAVRCAPYDDRGPAGLCFGGEAHLPGTDDCRPIGSPCPTGDYAEGLPTDRPVVFVRPGADPDAATGDRSAPFADIDAALAAVTDGTVIALAKGNYDARLALDRTIELRGACAAETFIQPSGSSSAAIVAIGGGDVTLADLRMGYASAAGITVSGGRLTLLGVEVAGTRGVGLAANGAAEVIADGLAIAYVGPDSTGRFGRGLSIEASATATIRRATFVESDETQVYVSGTLDLEDVVIRGPEMDPFGLGGFGAQLVALENGGVLSVTRAHISESPREAVTVSASEAHFTDTVIEGSVGESVRATEHARVALTRVHTTRAPVAVLALAGAEVEIDGLIASGAWEGGVMLVGGAKMFGQSLAIFDSAEVAFMADGAGTAVELDDLIIIDTGPGTEGRFGRAFNLQQGAQATIHRASLLRSRDAAVIISGADTSLDFEDLRVLDTQSRSDDGRSGAGMLVQGGGRVVGQRLAIARCQGHGILALGAGSIAAVGDLEMTDVTPQSCVVTDCPTNGRGIGLASYSGANLSAERFRIGDAALCGVLADNGGAIALTEGRIERTIIGACSPNGDLALEQLGSNVRFSEVERPIDAPSLPVPDPEPPISPRGATE